ncbi:MAG: zinc ABC transporter substrate-binding protein [Dehalococcoidales bacterium]|nr:zinc ABC transporter substrate-binding protein [Dehalococcoidales bacterium]
MKRLICFFVVILISIMPVLGSCQADAGAGTKKRIVVTYSVLGSIVKELVGEKADVAVSIPNGLDPHQWEPSAKDIEVLSRADLIVKNGLEFEAGMHAAFETARNKGIKMFTASDYIEVRYVGDEEPVEGEHIHETGEEHLEENEHGHEHHHEAGSPDPHLWTDPVGMNSIVAALSEELKVYLDMDVSREAADLRDRLANLDMEIEQIVQAVPDNNRKLVTGHQSMGYFARRYHFEMIGAIIPSISTQAGVTAADLAELKKAIEKYQVPAIFTELGTSPAVAGAIRNETGVKVVEITMHKLPEDGSYFTMMKVMAESIAGALK